MKQFLLLFFVSLLLLSCTEQRFEEEISGDCIIRFTVPVNIQSVYSGGDSSLEDDWGVLLLPDDYYNRHDKSPIQLVIYCHSGGGTVSNNGSEAEESEFVKYFVSKGYAVLSMAGMPLDYAKELKLDIGRTVGSPVSLTANILGYKHVVSNYNIQKDGCFLFSNSNGGLMASNIVNLTDIPVLAQSGVAPLISIEKNAWDIDLAKVGNYGEFEKYQNRVNIIRQFGMKPVTTQIDVNNAIFEKNKVNRYDPFDYCVNQSTKIYNTPYLIFAHKNDMVVLRSIADEFATVMNKRGSEIIIDDGLEIGGHYIAAKPTIIGSFVYRGERYDLRLTPKTVVDFFEKNTAIK